MHAQHRFPTGQRHDSAVRRRDPASTGMAPGMILRLVHRADVSWPNGETYGLEENNLANVARKRL